MKTGLTWVLIGLAIVLGVVVFWFDRAPAKPIVLQSGPLFSSWNAAQISSVDFFYSSNKFVRVLKEGERWNLQAPLRYPANEGLVQKLIASVGELSSEQYIPGSQMVQNNRKLEDYGVKPFHHSLILQHGEERVEIRLGNKTVGEDEIFFQLIGKDGVYLTSSAFAKMIPDSEEGWRDSRVVKLEGEPVSKISFQAPAPYGFELSRLVSDPKKWCISRPTPFRADSEKVKALMNLFSSWEVKKFVTDNPREFNERYGLEHPQAELTFSFLSAGGVSTNQTAPEGGLQERNVSLQFGNVDITDTNLAYINLIRDSNTNVILAEGEFLRNLMFPWQAFRNTHLWDVQTNEISAISFKSFPADAERTGGFLLKKVNSQEWDAIGLGGQTLSGTNTYRADQKVVDWLLEQLTQTEILEVTKDVVTDYSPYGLKSPFQSICVERDNLPMQQVDFGLVSAPAEGEGDSASQRVYTRTVGSDLLSSESSVCEVSLKDAMKFPTDAFQMSNREIMNFTTNDFVQTTFLLGERKRVVQRNAAGVYKIVGYDATIPEEVLLIMDELVYRLGTLRSESWIYMGESIPEEFGIETAGRSLSVEYLDNGNGRTCELIFGDLKIDGMSVAVVKRADNRWWGFKFAPVAYEFYADMLDILMGRDAIGKK